MAYYSSIGYDTTNKSNRDITKDFDIKQFNTKFEENDKELQNKLDEEYKPKINDLKDTCQNDYDNKYLKYGIIFISSGLGLLLILLIIYSYNKSKKI
jgi:hypothetical protein